MKKTIAILLIASFLAFSLTSCGGSGGGSGISGVIDKITGKKTIDYSFANKNFGYGNGTPGEILFLFTSDTAVTHKYGGSNHVGTYTAEKAKTGTLTITYTDGTTYSKPFSFGDDGNKVTGVTIDGLIYSRY